MNDIRQTAKYAKYLKKIGWQVERIDEINYFIKKFPLVGSVLKIQRPENIIIKKIQGLAQKHRAFQIIVEPKTRLDADFLRNLGFGLSRYPYLPTKTLYLDLTKSEGELFSQLKKDARLAIKRAQMSEIKYQKRVDLREFRNAWKRAVGWKHYVPALLHLKALKESFADKCLVLTALKQEIVSGAIFLMGETIAHYWQAFSNEEGRKNLAQYKILWEGILWARTKGAKIFDFEGIYDERFPNKKWKGFTHFKKSFGGHEVEYPGAFVKWSLKEILQP